MPVLMTQFLCLLIFPFIWCRISYSFLEWDLTSFWCWSHCLPRKKLFPKIWKCLPYGPSESACVGTGRTEMWNSIFSVKKIFHCLLLSLGICSLLVSCQIWFVVAEVSSSSVGSVKNNHSKCWKISPGPALASVWGQSGAPGGPSLGLRPL